MARSIHHQPGSWKGPVQAQDSGWKSAEEENQSPQDVYTEEEESTNQLKTSSDHKKRKVGIIIIMQVTFSSSFA